VSGPDRSAGAVSRRIATVFGVRITAAVIGVANAFVLARLLEPAGKGDFYLVQLVPSTLLVLGQIGLPSAIAFYAGRGQTSRLGSRTLALALGMAATGMVLTLLALPLLSTTVFRAVNPVLVVVAVAIVPFTFLFTFANAILTGRQRVGIYGAVAMGQVVAALVLFVVLIGIFHLGVAGAIVAYLLYSAGAAAVVAVAALRVSAEPSDQPPVPMRSLFAYGLRLYPASLSGFFSYRADVYLLALLVADAAQLGLYSVAVGLAELVFFLPDSVVVVFFPHVAGGTRVEADAQAAVVTRITIAATGLAAIPLAVASFVAVNLVLPAYTASLPALYMLLPGVVMLSASKTLTAYLNGIGRGGTVSITALLSLGINIMANLLLIPAYGIVGAAAASLVSYTLSAGLQIAICSRITGQSPLAFVVPTRTDLAMILAAVGALARRVRAWRFVPGSGS
jgi:O-antigen/teichoic acid export membrane protein